MAMPLDRLRKLAPLKAVSLQLDNDVRRSQRRNERNYNARKHASPFNVAKGQHVHVRDNIRSDKYEPMWTAAARYRADRRLDGPSRQRHGSQRRGLGFGSSADT